jgi:hypothetical protein
LRFKDIYRTVDKTSEVPRSAPLRLVAWMMVAGLWTCRATMEFVIVA